MRPLARGVDAGWGRFGLRPAPRVRWWPAGTVTAATYFSDGLRAGRCGSREVHRAEAPGTPRSLQPDCTPLPPPPTQENVSGATLCDSKRAPP